MFFHVPIIHLVDWCEHEVHRRDGTVIRCVIRCAEKRDLFKIYRINAFFKLKYLNNQKRDDEYFVTKLKLVTIYFPIPKFMQSVFVKIASNWVVLSNIITMIK